LSRVLAKRALISHPGSNCEAISGCDTKVELSDEGLLKIEYVVTGDIRQLALPVRVAAERADNLWTTTCFEAFFMSDDGQYCEFNFSPSTCWAAYRFSSYREGMETAHGGVSEIEIDEMTDRFSLTANLPINSYLRRWWQRIGLSAVFECRDGSKTFWALAHPPGGPDFHHKDCFALTLPAPEGS